MRRQVTKCRVCQYGRPVKRHSLRQWLVIGIMTNAVDLRKLLVAWLLELQLVGGLSLVVLGDFNVLAEHSLTFILIFTNLNNSDYCINDKAEHQRNHESPKNYD